MQAVTTHAMALSRRHFLKTGAMGGMLLATGSAAALLTGCAQAQPATGYVYLRKAELTVLRAVIPSVLAGTLPEGKARPAALDKALASLDQLLANSSVAVGDQIHQLFALLSMAPTRIAMAGVWSDWPDASSEDIEAFLLRWRDSRLELLRGAYLGLCKIINVAWYLLPESYAAVGYSAPVRTI